MLYIVIVAMGLMFVFEGIMPFLFPKVWRSLVIQMARQSDRSLRVMALVLMCLGTMIIIIAHQFI